MLLSCICCFGVMDQSHDSRKMFVNLYRGLLLGDGDGLDYMDLKAKDLGADSLQFLKTSTGVFATLVLFVIFLNLMIAVFSNEYDQINKKKWLLFAQDLAENSCLNILSYQKL